MSKKTIKMSLIFFWALSFLTVSIIAFMRMDVEKKNNSVEMIIEYQEVNRLANQSGKTINDWLVPLGEVGLQSVAIMEETLLQYANNHAINFMIKGQLINNGSWQLLYPEPVVARLNAGDNYDLLIEAGNELEYNTIINGLSFYKDIHFWSEAVGNQYFIVVDQAEKDLYYVDSSDIFNSNGRKIGTTRSIFGTEVLYTVIGYDPLKIEQIKQTGLKLMLRPQNYKLDPEGAWNLYVSEVEKYGMGDHLIAIGGDSVLGYGSDDLSYLNTFENYLNTHDFNMTITETMEQGDYFRIDGLEDVVNFLPKNKIVRMFNVWDFIQTRYKYYGFYTGGEEIGNTIYRAVTERNIRAVYFRPFIKSAGSYVTDINDYLKMFTDLERRLETHGYHYGEASTLDVFSLPLAVKMLLGVELLGFVLVLLNSIFDKIRARYNIVFCGLGAVMVCAAFYVAPNMAVTLTALGAAITFSTLAVVSFIKLFLLKEKGESILEAIKGLLLSVIIAFTGALFIGSIMADTEYFLELHAFKGVKLSLLAPIGLVCLIVAIFYIKEMTQEKQGKFYSETLLTTKNFLNMDIKIKYALILTVIAGIGYIYLARSGNATNLKPWIGELMFRNFLENHLLARPRTKEFMMAYPAMMVGIYYCKLGFLKKDKIVKYIYILAFSGMAVIGLTAITNTFSHIRTPLFLNLARTSYSVIFGLILGTIAILVLKAIGKLYTRVKNLVVKRVAQ